MSTKKTNTNQKPSETGKKTPGANKSPALNETRREHAEFHNSYRIERVKEDVEFLQYIYGNRLGISKDDVDKDFTDQLKSIGKNIYFFLLMLKEEDLFPQFY